MEPMSIQDEIEIAADDCLWPDNIIFKKCDINLRLNLEREVWHPIFILIGRNVQQEIKDELADLLKNI